MLFHYWAVDAKGKRREGEVDAPSLVNVLNYLNNQGLKAIRVKPVSQVKKISWGLKEEKISLPDKIFLFKYLSLMLKVGTDLFKAIDILIEDFPAGAVRRFLLEVRSHLEKGNPFYLAFSYHAKDFSPVIANLIKAGEASGNLDLVLDEISQDLERQRDLRAKIRSALTYPIILLVMAFLLTIFLVTFLVPKMATAFFNIGTNIPSYSRIVLGIGLFLNKYMAIALPLLIFIPLGLLLYFTKTKSGRDFITRLGELIPVTRNLTEKIALERFTSILSNLIKAGMPIINALQLTAQAVSYPKYREALMRIANDYLPRGVNLGEAFRREKIFPNTLTNLIFVGEKAGHTEEILATLSKFYTSEIENSLKILTAFLEPLLLVFIGLIVGGLALAVIVPVYQMVGQF